MILVHALLCPRAPYTYGQPCAHRPATLELLKKNNPQRCQQRADSVLGEYKVSLQERAHL